MELTGAVIWPMQCKEYACSGLLTCPDAPIPGV